MLCLCVKQSYCMLCNKNIYFTQTPAYNITSFSYFWSLKYMLHQRWQCKLTKTKAKEHRLSRGDLVANCFRPALHAVNPYISAQKNSQTRGVCGLTQFFNRRCVTLGHSLCVYWPAFQITLCLGGKLCCCVLLGNISLLHVIYRPRKKIPSSIQQGKTHPMYSCVGAWCNICDSLSLFCSSL